MEKKEEKVERERRHPIKRRRNSLRLPKKNEIKRESKTKSPVKLGKTR